MLPLNAVARRARHAARPRAWAALARQIGWEAGELLGRSSSVELTWMLPEDVASRTRVLWPARYSSTNASEWMDPLRRGLEYHASVVDAEVPQEEGNLALVSVEFPASSIRVAIDYDDQSILHQCADSVHLYFKMQYRRGGYGRRHVVPGGYVSRMPGYYRNVSRWRAWHAGQREKSDVFARFGLLEPGAAMRRTMLAQMRSQRSLVFHGGTSRTTSWEHLEDICGSRVALDAPGRGELCGRLIECLGVGACVLGPRLENELHIPLVSGVHELRVDRDLTGFVPACEALVHDEERRRKIAHAAADYFDRYLRLEQLGGYYLDRCLDRNIGE
jgi:hypothetical protein